MGPPHHDGPIFRSLEKSHDQRDRRNRPKNPELNQLLRPVTAETRRAQQKQTRAQNQPDEGRGALHEAQELGKCAQNVFNLLHVD